MKFAYFLLIKYSFSGAQVQKYNQSLTLESLLVLTISFSLVRSSY
jgi:hypothetical protein